MLRLILSADRQRNSQEVIERICAAAKKRVGGQILIVPEQYSHAVERALCAAGGDSISRYAEVLSFTRLAGRLFSIYGGVCEEYLDKGGRLLSVYLAVEQVRSRLKYYAAVSTRPEFLQRLGAAIEEFMSYCMTPEILRQTAERVSGQFAQKLEELALIYESYLSVCKTGRSDPVTRLERLSALLRETDYASEHLFYLDGFSDFTAIEAQSLVEILRRAPEVTVALTTDGSGKSIFRAAASTMSELKKTAARWNVPVTTEHPTAAGKRSQPLCQWLDELFAVRQNPLEQTQNAVRLHMASAPDKECEFAAERVRTLLLKGTRCREIAIALSDRTGYEPTLRTLFSRMQIPAYFAGNEDILRQPFFAAVLAAMDAVERYDADAVLSFLKSGFVPIERDAADKLEKYAFTWDIRGKAWEHTWTMHPDGYAQKWDDASRMELSQIEQWRAIAMQPLAELRQKWRKAKNVAEMTLALDEFLTKNTFVEKLEEQAKKLEDAQQQQQAQSIRQMYEILIGAMEQMYQVLGMCVMAPEQFTDVFRMLLSQYQIGTIPASVDQIQVGSMETFRNLSAKHLIVLGAEEGKMPSFSMQSGVFTEEERQRLLAMGVALAPAQEAKLDRELGWIYAALCAAEESCTLVCSGAEPSFLFTRTAQMLPAAEITTDEDVLFAADIKAAAAELLYGQSPFPSEYPELYQQMQMLSQKAGYEFAPIETQTVQGLYGKEIALSASRIDRFASCRYAFFLYDGLRARAWKRAQFDAPAFGTFVHYVLEKTVEEVMAQGGFEATTEQSLRAIAQRHIEQYSKNFLADMQTRGERFVYLYERSLQEVLNVVSDVGEELRRSRFVPQECELKFARDGVLPPIYVEAENGRAVVSGLVDRVDLYESEHGAYYRIVDYKTGKKELDYAALLCGEGLQMLIYLFALREHGKAHYGKPLFPAGVLYVPARDEMVRVTPGTDEEKLEALRASGKQRKGILLKDEAVLQAMEPSGDEKPRYLPYQIVKKTGEYKGDLATREQLQMLESFVMRTLSEMTGEMLTGRVTPNPILRGPKSSSCMYCEFAQACHKDTCLHQNRYIADVKADKFWTEVERRLQNG